jgi:hypothetical protein
MEFRERRGEKALSVYRRATEKFDHFLLELSYGNDNDNAMEQSHF